MIKLKKYIFEENNYELIKNYKNGFEEETIREKFTDYFVPYDYVVGDWSYGTLRLKGFYDSKNKNCLKINDYNKLTNYLKENCSYDCKYFVLKKV